MTPLRDRLFTLAVVAVTCLGLDQATKRLATLALRGTRPFTYLAGTLRLEYTENAGAFLGLGGALPLWERQALLTVAAGFVLAALGVFVCWHRELKVPDLVGYALILAGGASNLVDRVLAGTVVDFLNVGVGPFRTGIFNVADLAITSGLALVVAAHAARQRSASR